ncbi:MAG: amidase [Marinobacter sp.]|nr:amidase [Marinobacter sp.]
MKREEYLQQDATGLAGLIRDGEVTTQQVVAAAVDWAGTVNPTINAICQPQFAEALSTQLPPAGPFAGVPFLLKDLAQEQAGIPCTYGSRGLRHFVPEQDSDYVARSKQAGLVILGRAATPELGLKAITEPRLWGVCRNPWDTALTPGGSSGGSGAAVAAGIVPMAGANDGGGSIRIPAAYNGLVGLKPSRGRVPAGPRVAENWTGASADHVVCRSVRDSARMLDVLAGPASGDPFVIGAPDQAFAELAAQSPRTLRIGVFTESPYGTEVARECVEAAESVAKLLESLGHNVEYARPAIDGKALARCYLGLYFGEVSATMAWARKHLNASDSDFELETRLLGMLGDSLPLADYVNMRRQWNDFGRALGQYFETYDLYLSPTTGQLPARIGQLATPTHLQAVARLMLMLRAGRLVHLSGAVEQMALDNLARTPFTQLANLTGTPAISLPLHWTADGLPVGVQLGARFGDETTLLQLATQLEQARPWVAHHQRLFQKLGASDPRK